MSEVFGSSSTFNPKEETGIASSSEAPLRIVQKPEIPEKRIKKEFSVMLRTKTFFDAEDALVKENQNLFYLVKGKLLLPDFMVFFLQDEYYQKWKSSTYSSSDYFVERGPMTRLKTIILPDGVDPITSERMGITTVQRICHRYREEQIKRMNPEERAKALAEDEALKT